MTCIEHTQKGDSGGYARSTCGGRTVVLHRLVYIRYYNLDLADIHGMVIRHTCDNPRCINPDHLLLGTQQDNMDDRCARQRTTKGEGIPQSKLTVTQVRYIRKHYKPRSKDYNQRVLGEQFGVDSTTIGQIVRGQLWVGV